MWHEVDTTRRHFLRGGILSSAVILTSGCSVFGITTSRDTLRVVQNDLFPKAKVLGINCSDYISIIYRQHKIPKWEKKFLKNGVKWLNESAYELHKKSYVKLSEEKRQEVLKVIAKEQWGHNWIETLLRYIFESMLGDPIYGTNREESGWKWLAFEGGKPRAKWCYL